MMKKFSYVQLSDLQLEGICGGNGVTAGFTASPSTTSVGGGNAPTYITNFYGPVTIYNNNTSIINVTNNTINGSLDISVLQINEI